MTLYVIENDDGCVLDQYCKFNNDVNTAMLFDEPIAPAEYTKDYGGHVVPLAEMMLVEVSEAEDEKLREAKASSNPMNVLWWSSTAHVGDTHAQNRLMRAYVNGWTIKKPKQWNVKVPHAANSYYYDMGWGNGIETQDYKLGEKPLAGFKEAQFSADDITRCGLQDCEKVEI